jgi:release factor glutamine methyltransferase
METMLPTPSTSHVSFDSVYEPSEDSFLLLDTVASTQEATFLKTRFSSRGSMPLVMEVGTGSGVVLAFLTAHSQSIFGHSAVGCLATDINQNACHAAEQTVHKAAAGQSTFSPGMFLDVINADLATPLRRNCADVLLFNPPYVPTEETPDELQRRMESASELGGFERNSNLLALSYAGGKDGMETTNRLLEALPSLLDPTRGVAYILLCARNRPTEVAQQIMEWGPGWSVRRVGSSGKKAGYEVLQVLRIWRT